MQTTARQIIGKFRHEIGGRRGWFGGNHEPYYELSGSRRFQLLSGLERPHVNLHPRHVEIV